MIGLIDSYGGVSFAWGVAVGTMISDSLFGGNRTLKPVRIRTRKCVASL